MTPVFTAAAPLVAPCASLSDEEVVARVIGGETALFEILMRRHNERIYRAARAILRDDSEAEDVMQQAYVNAYTHLRQFDGRAQFATWLTKIAVHDALARVRRRGRHGPRADSRLETLRPIQPTAESERETCGRTAGALLES